MKKISVQLNQTTKLLTIRPDTVEFIYTKGKAKKVPVKLQGKVALDRQYYISDIIYSPDSVMVYAPQEILDTITAAYTQALNFEDVADTIRRRVNLADVRGAKFIPSFDDVTLLVDIYAEKSVEVPIRGINFPPDKVLRTFPSKVQVTFQVGLSLSLIHIYYGAYSDKLSHLHFHLVPKYVDGPDYGGVFQMNPGKVYLDLGHTPFGHAGERAINSYTGHFKHNEQSLRLVELYGRKGKGLNLTLSLIHI